MWFFGIFASLQKRKNFLKILHINENRKIFSKLIEILDFDFLLYPLYEKCIILKKSILPFSHAYFRISINLP